MCQFQKSPVKRGGRLAGIMADKSQRAEIHD